MAAPWGMKAAEMEPSVAFREIGVKGPRRELVQVGFCARVPVRAARVRAEVSLKLNMMTEVAATMRMVEVGVGIDWNTLRSQSIYARFIRRKESSCPTTHPPTSALGRPGENDDR